MLKIDIKKASLDDLLDEKDRIEKILMHTAIDTERGQIHEDLSKINKQIEKIMWWRANGEGFAELLAKEIELQAAAQRKMLAEQEAANEKPC